MKERIIRSIKIWSKEFVHSHYQSATTQIPQFTRVEISILTHPMQSMSQLKWPIFLAQKIWCWISRTICRDREHWSITLSSLSYTIKHSSWELIRQPEWTREIRNSGKCSPSNSSKTISTSNKKMTSRQIRPRCPHRISFPKLVTMRARMRMKMVILKALICWITTSIIIRPKKSQQQLMTPLKIMSMQWICKSKQMLKIPWDPRTLKVYPGLSRRVAMVIMQWATVKAMRVWSAKTRQVWLPMTIQARPTASQAQGNSHPNKPQALMISDRWLSARIRISAPIREAWAWERPVDIAILW